MAFAFHAVPAYIQFMLVKPPRADSPIDSPFAQSRSQPSDMHRTLVLFRLNDQRCALSLGAVERVVRAVAVTPVPKAPAFVLGLINVAGRLLTVISLRACLGLPDRAIRSDDQFILAQTPQLTLALVVDEVLGLSACDDDGTVAATAVLPPGDWCVQSLIKIDGEIVLIYDLDKLVSHEDQARILEMKARINSL